LMLRHISGSKRKIENYLVWICL